MKKRYFALAALLPAFLLSAFIRTTDPLQQCWNLQVKPLQEKFMMIGFEETSNELHHSFYPWQQTTYNSTGCAWWSVDHFLKADTIQWQKNILASALDYTPAETLFRGFADDSLSPVTPSMHAEQLLQVARYTPALLVDYFHEQKSERVKNTNPAQATYRATIHGMVVDLSIDKERSLVQEVTWLSHHEQFGDARTTISYQSYALENGVNCPHQVVISKINGKLHDTVRITSTQPVAMLPVLLKRPSGYTMKEDPVVEETVTVSDYNDHIHFVEFKQADARSLVVEFKDFLLVAEAPLSSENGELLIREAQKIAPGKPIKYFAFGHYHPHYLGGVRPFVHRGATILTVEGDKEFVSYIASAPRTLHPDSLHMEPAPLKTEVVNGKTIISDGAYSLEIHFIGELSTHTNDYLLYYFPEEKMLFEDDLAKIPREGEIGKAGKRQKALYDAVKTIGLQVDTVVQGWPLYEYGLKTIFSFSDLEKSVNAE